MEVIEGPAHDFRRRVSPNDPGDVAHIGEAAFRIHFPEDRSALFGDRVVAIQDALEVGRRRGRRSGANAGSLVTEAAGYEFVIVRHDGERRRSGWPRKRVRGTAMELFGQTAICFEALLLQSCDKQINCGLLCGVGVREHRSIGNIQGIQDGLWPRGPLPLNQEASFPDEDRPLWVCRLTHCTALSQRTLSPSMEHANNEGATELVLHPFWWCARASVRVRGSRASPVMPRMRRE